MVVNAGDVKAFKRSFTQKDFDRFARLTRDDNPIHVDPDFSARTRFGKTVAHGMMLYSTISRVLGSHFPGPGTLQIKQEMMFRHPTHTDTEITTRLEVLEIQRKKHLARIRTTIRLPGGHLACDGNTVVHLPGWQGGFPGVDEGMDIWEASGDKRLRHLKIGQHASTKRTFTPADHTEYTDLTGDANPLYRDREMAIKAGFKDCIVPGPLLSGMFSDLLGTRLPGRGTNWLKQYLHFPAPAHVGEKITATVKIVRLRPEKNLVNLLGTCINAAGEPVCQAQSLVLVKDMEDMGREPL